jgi:hypothetical protein
MWSTAAIRTAATTGATRPTGVARHASTEDDRDRVPRNRRRPYVGDCYATDRLRSSSNRVTAEYGTTEPTLNSGSAVTRNQRRAPPTARVPRTTGRCGWQVASARKPGWGASPIAVPSPQIVVDASNRADRPTSVAGASTSSSRAASWLATRIRPRAS